MNKKESRRVLKKSRFYCLLTDKCQQVTKMANGEDFLCGVVEGFYSRPWSVDQRLDLYEKMEKYGLNTYVCTDF